MTPATFKAIRKRFFPDDPAGFLFELGAVGKRNTVLQRARGYENGKIEIPKLIARYAWLFDQWRLMSNQLGGDLNDLPLWPDDL